MVVLLAVSAGFTYQCSFNVLWFRLGPLFDIVAAPSRNNEVTPRIEIDEDTFFFKLYNNYSFSSRKVVRAMRVLFSSAMATYIVTVEIILWQIKTADAQQAADAVTKWIWPFISLVLSVLLILLQPWFIVMSLLNKFFDERFDIDKLVIISCGCMVVVITLISQFKWGPFHYADSMLTKLSIVGITMMATLAGVASTSTLYSTFLTVKRRFFPSSRSQNFNLTGSLLWTADERVAEQIDTYKRNIKENVEILSKIDQEPGGKNSVMREQLMERIGWFQVEIGGLEKIVSQPSHVRNLKKAFSFAFLIYCLHKIKSTFTRTIPFIMAHSLNEAGQTSEWEADPLATTIAGILDLVIFRFTHQNELDSLAKQISLILSTSLFVTSLSTVASTISYLVALLPNRFRILAMHAMQGSKDIKQLPMHKGDPMQHYPKSPSIIKNLIVSELTGVYVVATILSIRSNLPFDVSEKVNELLGERFTVPSAVIDTWFELTYAISCLMTLVGIKFAERRFSSKSSWISACVKQRES